MRTITERADNPRSRVARLTSVLLILLCTTTLFGQDENAGDTVEERLRRLEERLNEALESSDTSVSERQDELEEYLEELEEELENTREKAETGGLGNTKFALTGDAYAQFRTANRGGSSFFAAFEPHFFWRINERISFGSGVEFELGLEDEDQTETEIVIAWSLLSYQLSNSVTLGVGSFLSPLGYYQENIHSQFVNRLPSKPLAVDDDDRGLVPLNDIGVQIRGPIILGKSRLTYVAWAGNGSELDDGSEHADDAGRLRSNNFRDSNRGKSVGGRVGFRPIYSLEFGYSALWMRVGKDRSQFEDVDAFLQAVDVSFVDEVPSLKGRLSFHGEWIWSDVDDVDFGSGEFDNRRNGGYIQLSYRPSLVSWEHLARTEATVRWDRLDEPSGTSAFDEDRWTFGLGYWVHPFSAFKIAYENSDRSGAPDVEAFLFEYVIGF